ncbi:hypothetical protein V8F06_000713 [Rhypophila decipiens]
MQAQDPRTPNQPPSQTTGRVRTTSSVSKTANAAALSAALQGATLAFQAGSGQKPASDRKADPISPSPGWLRVQSPNDHGAVQAASRAASQSLSRSRSPTGRGAVSRHGTGSSSVQELGSYNSDRERGMDRDLDSAGFTYDSSPRPSRVSSGNSPSMLAPSVRSGTDRKQASFIAATLAASRSGTPSPNHTGQGPAQIPLTSAQLHSRIYRRESLVADSRPTLSPSYFPQSTDTSSIPPANSLISLFESKKDDMDPVKKSDPLPRQQRGSAYPKVHPPTPPRSRTPELDIRKKPKPKPKPKPAGMAENLVIGTDAGLERGRSVKTEKRSDGQAGLLQVPTTIRKSTAQGDSRGGSQETGKQRSIVPPRTQSEGGDGHPRTSDPSSAVAPPRRGREADFVQPKTTPETSSRPPQLPPQRRTTKVKMTKPELKTDNVDILRQEYTKSRRLSQVSNSSSDTFVSASSTQSPRARSPVRDIDSGKVGGTHSLDRSPETRPSLPPRSSANIYTPNLPLESLSEAIMAGSLASARLSSPSVTNSQSVPPPLPAPRRHGTHRSHNPLHKLQKQITGDSAHGGHSRHKNMGGRSPQRTGMLQTLRAPVKSQSDDEETRRHKDKHRTKKLTGKGKHKHQEGSRRRWRDEITTRERRRYEAVWASNRGLFLRPGFTFKHPDTLRRSSPTPSHKSAALAQVVDEATAVQQQIDQSRAQDGTPEADYVANVVVRDIWSRSRLPHDELAEVWDLVDRKKEGVLGKQEFVVGMWLIDQRLRGRKIPARVSESVWESARGIGMKVMPAAAARDSKKKDRSH